jgi:hypothetical protein
MFRALEKQARGLFVLLAVLAIALAACSGGSKGSATPAPANHTAAPTLAAGDTAAAGDGSALGDAAAKFGDLSSYKFSMTWAGSYFGSFLSLAGTADASAGAPVTFGGTIIVKPAKAADITIGGMHMIEVDGMDYIDLGTGSFIGSKATGSSMADGFAPKNFFGMGVSSSTADGYKAVGDETKNGVKATHFQADASSLGAYGSLFKVDGGTWSSDVWVAKDGGYPVSLLILAKMADGSTGFELAFDVTDINSSSNVVTKPTNVTVTP